MTVNEPDRQEIEEQYQNYIESPKSRKQLETWYKQEQIRHRILFLMLFIVLCCLGFGQFAILDYSFGQRLALSDSDKILIFPIKGVLSLLVTAALPITTLVDESEILGQRIKMSLFGRKVSPIFFILLGDVFITFQAVLVGNQNAKYADPYLPAIAFVLAAISSTFAFYLSKGIVAAYRRYMSAREELQIIIIYGINPRPFYKNAEQIRLSEEYEGAVKEAEQKNKELEEIKVEKQNLEEQQTQDQEQLKQLQFLEAEQVQKIQQLEQKRQELERQISAYKSHADSVSQLKTNFNKVSKLIREFIYPGKKMFEDFASLDESIKDLKFPSLEVISSVNGNGKVVERPTYYLRWPKSNSSWQDLQLQSELSPVGVNFLSSLSTMVQQQELPVPNNIRNYAPRQELAQCLVIDFENYGVIVYCRDEEYRKIGGKWDEQAESDFENKLVNDQIRGYCTLKVTAQEVMRNQSRVLERIKDTINSKTGEEAN
ncbi:hypothetical protein DP113_07430 [Brasilonema octagenarum UFV-E1]|uniref:Uncharacterized protein n=1 Tax=Brasilonema sennae CENA114 TaxID=415709 RepID=A0A856MCD5_9CYAN|nr:hypothetical protein [Brasilonema sennae]QDL07759.1 hypothetical protein DP114_07475 [Brasilonema sennae CENA114]QDL14121.1 hypothetical protein DP113_07430 [Brasilonema octagenarum UFV-E1]